MVGVEVEASATGATETTIGVVAREYRVTQRTLRFYEHRGLLAPRRQGLARFYDENAKTRLALILKGKQLGFTLEEIRAMLESSNGATTDLSLSELNR